MPSTIPVYLELGRTWTFACALDWPGWCRRGKGEEAALEALEAYAGRYAAVVGLSFDPGALEVVGRLPGSATTDFGAPDGRGPWDDVPLVGDEADRQAERLRRVLGTPSTARWRQHPRSCARGRGAAAVTGTPWPTTCRRPSEPTRARPGSGCHRGRHGPTNGAALLDAIRTGTADGAWPARYAVRRIGWHVLDHAWEIEDRAV